MALMASDKDLEHPPEDPTAEKSWMEEQEQDEEAIVGQWNKDNDKVKDHSLQ
jgi:hypothetical protein